MLLGTEVSFEAAAALRLLSRIEAEQYEQLLQAILTHAAGALPPTATMLRRLQRSLSLEASEAGALFTGLHWLLRTCVRSGVKPKVLADELRDVPMHPPCIAPFLAAVDQGCAALGHATRASPPPSTEARARGRRSAASSAEALAAPAFPSLADLQAPPPRTPPHTDRHRPRRAPPTARGFPAQWRVDVAISTGGLGRVLRPHLTLACALDDGSSTTFHVSKQNFNELRCARACPRIL